MCVRAYETKFLWNTGPDYWVLEKILMSKSFVASSCGYKPQKEESFWEERFFCCFCFTVDESTTLKSKIFCYGFANTATGKSTSLTAAGFCFGGE